jgi:hypothetical protein
VSNPSNTDPSLNTPAQLIVELHFYQACVKHLYANTFLVDRHQHGVCGTQTAPNSDVQHCPLHPLTNGQS